MAASIPDGPRAAGRTARRLREMDGPLGDGGTRGKVMNCHRMLDFGEFGPDSRETHHACPGQLSLLLCQKTSEVE